MIKTTMRAIFRPQTQGSGAQQAWGVERRTQAVAKAKQLGLM